MPMLRRYTYFYYRPLQVEKMQQALDYLVGEHDFKSLCSVKTTVEDTVSTVLSGKVEQTPEDVVIIRITGTGFLYNMVRIIAGTLISVGIGELEPEDMVRILEEKDRSAAGATAPPQGLTMMGIFYP